MQLMDNTGLSDTELGNAANQVVAACSQRPELSGVRTSYATNTPSVAYTVDREKIKNLGIELSDVFTALQTNFGGSSVNDFTQFGRSYKVIVQADTSYRSQADSLNFISVKSSSGKMVPLDTLLTSSMTTGPSSITRFNGVRSVTIQGSAASGYSSGEAMAAAEEAAKSVMPTGMTIEWSGQSREESTSSSSTTKILLMALVFAFLCLAALYESWSMPFAVLFTVPTGIFGAVGSEYIIHQLATLFNANASGFLNSVYMQIGRHHDHRPGGQERHPHRRIRQRACRQGYRPDGSCRHRLQASPAANPHDGLYGHHRLPASGLCQRCRRRSPLRHGRRRRRRHDLCHPLRPAPHPGVLHHFRKNGPQLLESHRPETNQIQTPHVEAVKKKLVACAASFFKWLVASG